MDPKKYKIPTIVRGTRDWFVAYFYELPNSPGKYRKFQVKDGINYVHDIAQKEIEIQKLRDDVEFALQNGFNPFLPEQRLDNQIFAEEISIQIEEQMDAIQPWSMGTALTKFIDYCKWKNLSKNTVRTYQTFVNNIRDYLTEYNKLDLPASDFTETDAVKFLDLYYDEEEWTARTYNNHVSFFTTLFNRLKRLEKKDNNRSIQYDIDLSDIEQKTDKAEKNRYYTAFVADKVKNELIHHPNLYNYSKWIFYSCMRPREIRLLQIQHIDLQNRQIKAIGPTAKTGDRFVPISDELLKLINEMELYKKPLNWYVFGYTGQPGPEPHWRDYFSTLYRPIKLKLGLDDKYSLYGWKHTRVVNLLVAGFTDSEVMSLTGHADYESFKAYKRSLVVDYTAMKGKTIDFPSN